MAALSLARAVRPGRLKKTRHGPVPYRDRNTGESRAGNRGQPRDEAQAGQVALGMAPKRDAADRGICVSGMRVLMVPTPCAICDLR